MYIALMIFLIIFLFLVIFYVVKYKPFIDITEYNDVLLWYEKDGDRHYIILFHF